MRVQRRTALLGVAAISVATLAGVATGPAQAAPRADEKMQHLVVIYLENHSFDNLYGLFPGANGIAKAGAAHKRQVMLDGTRYNCLPQDDPHLTSPPLPADVCSTASGDAFDSHFRNAPFNIDQYIPQNENTRDLVHRYYQNQVQIDGGLNDKFTAVSDAQGLTQGYYDTAKLPLAKVAAKYTLADNFFQAAFGGSFLNHQWLVCACTPVFPNAPADMHTVLDPATGLPAAGLDGALTPAPDDHVINTAFPTYAPTPDFVAPDHRVPPQTLPTIGERLSHRQVSWAWYSGGWDDAVAGHPDPLFQFHHQPLNYFANFAPGTPGRKHLRDEKKFVSAAKEGRLPAVSFVKPIGAENEHPGYADVATGEQHVVDLINAVKSGPDWASTAIVVTYDEFGGFWDHVPPPVVDRWGPGTRIPAIVIAPFGRKNFVDHKVYDTTSILATIEHRWDLQPLTSRDANANDLYGALNLNR